MRTKNFKVFSVVLCVTLLISQLLSLNVFAAGQPDLVFTSAAITSKTSDKITYTYTIRNNGDATIPDLYNVSIQNFYSANTIFNDAGDKAAGGSILGVRRSLAPGESYTGTFYSLVAVPAGMNYLTFKIDWGGIVSESNENNNTKYLLLLPDLSITSAAVTSRTSDRITYTYTIRNNGGVTIPDLYNVSIQNFYSVNTIFNDADDRAAGGSILGVRRSLAPGESYTGTFYSLVAVPAGMNYLTFKIDWGGIVAESNENNNTRYLSLLPDLDITNLTITSRTSNMIYYTYTIKNIGGGVIPNLYNVSIQNFYCSSSYFDSTNGTAAGGRIIGVNMPLGPGETYTGTWCASGAVPSGKPYLTTKIDWGNIVTEYNEYNNTYATYVG